MIKFRKIGPKFIILVPLFFPQSTLDKETRKLEKMQEEESNSNSEDAIHLQEEKRERLAYEVDNLAKEVTLEQDKLTSTLLTLVS